MIRKEEVYKIGIFNKPHGIHGELSFTLRTIFLIVPIATTLFVCLTVFSFPFLWKNIVFVRILPLW